jgi:hypothetical protein
MLEQDAPTGAHLPLENSSRFQQRYEIGPGNVEKIGRLLSCYPRMHGSLQSRFDRRLAGPSRIAPFRFLKSQRCLSPVVVSTSVSSHPVGSGGKLAGIWRHRQIPIHTTVTPAGGWRPMCPLDHGESECSFHKNGLLR